MFWLEKWTPIDRMSMEETIRGTIISCVCLLLQATGSDWPSRPMRFELCELPLLVMKISVHHRFSSALKRYATI
jgi:hypothetical protein